jgi:NADH:ubiquinone oxidoreductase subunit 6 (subunit J)
MAEILFFIAGTGAVAGAVGVIVLRNPFYSVLSLVGHLLCLAALFLLLRAEFVAVAQVVVYAGAVMVLYVFVVAYVGGDGAELPAPTGPIRVIAPVAAGLLFVELAVALAASDVPGLTTEGAPYVEGFGSPAQIGQLFLGEFTLAFELAAFLLLVGAVGAVTLSRRRGGLEGSDVAPAARLDVRRPLGTGTMAEAVEGRLPPGEPTDAHERVQSAGGEPEETHTA